MKKLLILTCMMIGFAGIAEAQTQPVKVNTKPVTKMAVVKPATATPAAKVIKIDKPATVATKTPVKADGSPDMRFKTNKNTVKSVPAGPLKADGTPDLRFKTNKTLITPTKAKGTK